MLPWIDSELESRWRRLHEILQHNEKFWRPQAFTYLKMSWESEHAALVQQLRKLSLPQAEQLASDDIALADFLSEFIPDAIAVAQATAVPKLSTRPVANFANAERAVPGRKWQQIIEFISALPGNKNSTLEWCAGKAHLGRAVARAQQCHVTALEWNAELIADGRRLAQHENLPLTFQKIDVMSAQAINFISAEQRVIALHACGDLHTQLLRGCAQRKPDSIALAPCCYHLTQEHLYKPLSQYALQHSDFYLMRDDLRTAVQGSVTSPPRVQQQRKLLQAWCLGFDLLQRELRGIDEYWVTPSFPVSVLQQGFAAFCRQLAAIKKLELSASINFSFYENAGSERLREVTALDLPRLLFRRALEVWLALDRALYLREFNYAVELGVFCPRQLTPRNLLIRARYLGLAST